MNAQTKIETGKMTSKGQVLIPKALRDEAGLSPNGFYKMRINNDGEIVVGPIGYGAQDAELRRERMITGLKKLRGKYPNPDGLSTDEIMREIRGDWEP